MMRAKHYTRELSGKGVNVSAALDASGIRTRAVVVLGADARALIIDSPQSSLLRVVETSGVTRVNTTITDPTGSTTKVNAPIEPLSSELWNRALEAVILSLDELDADWLMLCGSVPLVIDEHDVQSPADFTTLLEAANQRKIRVAVDSSGGPLRQLVSAGGPLAVIKPNTAELADLMGRRLDTIGDVVGAARKLVAEGIEQVLVSMGADGLLLVSGDLVVHAHAIPLKVSNTAGAGDAALAGFITGYAHSHTAVESERMIAAASSAAAYGAHGVSLSGTLVLDVDDLPAATVMTSPEAHTLLTEPAMPLT